MWEGVAVAVISGVILAFLGWVWNQRAVLRDWWTRGTAAADEQAELLENERVATLREQVMERAKKLGARLPVSASG